MFSNRLAIAALGVGCISAAAAGGYMAARQTTAPTPASAQATTAEATPATPTTAEAPGAARPVQETEAVIGDVAKPIAPVATPAPSPTPSPAKPSSASARRAEAQPPARSERPASAARDTREATTTTARQTTAPRQEPPPLANTWPSSATQPSTSPAAPPIDTTSSARVEDRTTQQETARTSETQKTFEELVIPADAVVGLQTENRLSSETARVEDRVEARVTRDVRVGDRIAIPAGTHAIGSVMQVDRGGKFKERARLGIRFNQLVLADGTRVSISTDTIYRDGDAPGNASAAKVGGGAVGGAILGAILGGAKGAAIGATAGAGGGTAAVMAGKSSEVVLPPGTPLTVRVLSPVTITSEKE